MSVKFIFRALIGTVVVIVLSCLVIEWFNIFVVTSQLQSMQRVAARQACILFSEETFKRDNKEVKLETIPGVDSNIYNGSDAETVYNNLFTDSKIKTYVKTKLGISNSEDIPWSSFKYWYQSRVEKESNVYGDLYSENLVTPLNMGITYLDQDTVSKIYKWNMAAILKNNASTGSGSGSSSMGTHAAYGPYVDYRGFRIWLNTVKIPQITYKMYDLSDVSDSDEFNKITHLGEKGKSYTEYVEMANPEENKYVVVASVDYTCDVNYKGITPLRNIINFANAKAGVGKVKNFSSIKNKGKGWTATLNQDGAGDARIAGGSIKYYVVR